jgi:uncharacterized membrane protein YqjE
MATEYAPRGGPSDRESAASLFSRLIGDARALVRNEIALAKHEIAEAATNAKLGLAALAIAAVVMLAGAMALIAALILGLAEVMEPWAAALVVGAVLGIIGIALFATAKRKLAATKHPLPRTQSALHQDAAMIARRT